MLETIKEVMSNMEQSYPEANIDSRTYQDYLVKEGILEPAPVKLWAAPCFVISKKNARIWLLTSFREVIKLVNRQSCE